MLFAISSMKSLISSRGLTKKRRRSWRTRRRKLRTKSACSRRRKQPHNSSSPKPSKLDPSKPRKTRTRKSKPLTFLPSQALAWLWLHAIFFSCSYWETGLTFIYLISYFYTKRRIWENLVREHFGCRKAKHLYQMYSYKRQHYFSSVMVLGGSVYFGKPGQGAFLTRRHLTFSLHYSMYGNLASKTNFYTAFGDRIGKAGQYPLRLASFSGS